MRVTLSWPVRDDGIHVLRIEVSDTGVGVPEEARKRIFQPFGQADGSISRRFSGTGLGLAISKRLVDLMGDKFGFISRPAAGATFWVELVNVAPRYSGAGHQRCSVAFSAEKTNGFVITSSMPC